MAAWGRQSGKTTYGLDKMTIRPLQGRKEGIYWNVLQTYSAAEVAFKRFYKMHRDSGLLRGRPHFADLYFTVRNNSTIFFKSGEVFEDLRVETLDGAIIDEYRQQRPQLWPMVIRPMLARQAPHSWCDFLSSCNGFDHFYDLFEFAKEHPEEWATFHAPSSEAWWWTPNEIASARSTMSQAEFDQEILALFRDITKGKAYGCYGDWNERLVSPFTDTGILHPQLPVFVTLDFNVAPMAWTLVQGAVKNFYAFDMVYIPRTEQGTFEAAQVLVLKLREYKIKAVTLVGDATGKAQKTSASGQTDYTIICAALDEAGISWENITPESNPAIKDRVNCMNAHLKAADGSVTFFLHPVNCAPLRKDFQRVTWKQGTGKLDEGTDRMLTHASDGVGYLLHEVDPMKLFEDNFELTVL